MNDFQTSHFTSQPSPDECTDRDVVELKAAIVELEQTVAGIESRCDSDGVYMALRVVMQQSAWKPKQLADQMTKGPHALKIADAPKDQITYEQLLHFRERRMITHTPNSLAFLLQKCGSSSKSKKPLKAEKFISSFEHINPIPLEVDRVLSLSVLGNPSGETAARSTSSDAGEEPGDGTGAEPAASGDVNAAATAAAPAG